MPLEKILEEVNKSKMLHDSNWRSFKQDTIGTARRCAASN